jgi:hypothetical protein
MADEFEIWIRRIKAVEREYFAALFSVERSLEHVRQDPTLLTSDLRVRDLEHAYELLEGTYIIRLFAEFETSIRIFSQKARRRPPPSKTKDLLDSVAARRGIPPDLLRNAHAVRDYRNDLVHEREGEADPMPIGEARGHLCVYFSFLPRNW